MIRAGANVTLLTELGYVRERPGCVYLWPDKTAAESLPLLVLRIVVLQKARKTIYFVTSILDPRVMSDSQVLQIAKSRWGIEVFLRSWKQTFDMRQLRSHKSEHAFIELDWSLMGLWGICLLVSRAIIDSYQRGPKTSRNYRRLLAGDPTAILKGDSRNP